MDLNKILSRLGEDVTMMFALESEFLIEKGYPDEAVYLCLDGIKMFPKYVAGYTMLAKSYIVLGRLDEALATIEEAIKKFPRHKTLINFAKYELGIEYDEFNLSNFREIIERDNSFVFDYSSKGYRESVLNGTSNVENAANNKLNSIDLKQKDISYDDFGADDFNFDEEINEVEVEINIPNRNFHNTVVEAHQNYDIDEISRSQNTKSYSISIDINNIPNEYKLDEEIDIYKETNSADFNTIPGLYDFKSTHNLIDMVIDNELKFDKFEISLNNNFDILEHKFYNNKFYNSKPETQSIELDNKEEIETYQEMGYDLDDKLNLENQDDDILEIEDNLEVTETILDELVKLNEFYPNNEDTNDLGLGFEFDLESAIDSSELGINLEIDIESELNSELQEIVLNNVLVSEPINFENSEFDFDKNLNDDILIDDLIEEIDFENDGNEINEDELDIINSKNISLENLEDIFDNKIDIHDLEDKDLEDIVEINKTKNIDDDSEFRNDNKIQNKTNVNNDELKNEIAELNSLLNFADEIEIETDLINNQDLGIDLDSLEELVNNTLNSVEIIENNKEDIEEDTEVNVVEKTTVVLNENKQIESESLELELLDDLIEKDLNFISDENKDDVFIESSNFREDIDNLESLLGNEDNLDENIELISDKDLDSELLLPELPHSEILLNELEVESTIEDKDIEIGDTIVENSVVEDLEVEDILQSEIKKVDILTEVNTRLANAEYSWAEVERLLNENDTKNAAANVETKSNIESNDTEEEELDDEPSQTSLLPVSETLAKIYETQEAYEDSIKIYKKLIIKSPEKADLYNRNIKRIKKIIKKLEKKQK